MTNLNVLERAIQFINPKWAEQRQASLFRLGAYRAVSSRLNRIDQSVGINAANDLSLERLISKSHSLVRNNPIAARIVEAWTNALVGTGIITTGDNPQINDLWSKWLEGGNASHDERNGFYGLQRLMSRAMVASGGPLIRFSYDPEQLRRGICPLKLQILEPRMIDLSRNHTRRGDGSWTTQGVEFDRQGKRTGYWLYDEDPSDMISLRTGSRLVPIRTRSEAYEHLFRQEWPGQVHGVPWLTPVLTPIEQLGDFQEAELVKQRIQACLSVFITGGTTSIGKQSVENGKLIESLSPGMMKELGEGSTVSVVNPAQTVNPQFVAEILRRISVGVGLMSTQIDGNLSTINYSAFKGGDALFRRTREAAQWHVLIPAIERIRAEFVTTCKMFGLLPFDANETVTHVEPGLDSVEPLKDAQATELEMAMGLTLWEQAVAARGYDPEKQFADLKKPINAEMRPPLPGSARVEPNEQQGNEADPTRQPAVKTPSE